jgi:hypothetical protein
VLPAHYGEEAERLFADWAETFAPLDVWAEAAVRSSGPEFLQLVWTLEPVTLDTGTG